MRQLIDIQSACGDVGGDQHRQRAVLELRQRFGARRLALVAVDCGGGNAVRIQFFREPVRAVFGAGEHQHLLPVVVLDQVGEQVALQLLRHQMDALLD